MKTNQSKGTLVQLLLFLWQVVLLPWTYWGFTFWVAMVVNGFITARYGMGLGFLSYALLFIFVLLRTRQPQETHASAS